MVDGHPRQVWWKADGETILECYTVIAMAHGTPLGRAADDRRYGKQGAFLIEAGISSSCRIAKFFGLADWIGEANRSAMETPSTWLPCPLAGAHDRSDPALKSKLAPQKRHRVIAVMSRVLTAVGLKS
jgi:hypothetical protein